MNKKYWIDKKRLKDPIYWFMKASDYRSAVLFLMEEFSKIKDLDKITHIFNAINTTPYLTGIGCELYMKGYLVFKGVKPDELREKKIGHNLRILREKCIYFNDYRFNDKRLIFITDTLGEHLMEDGGIRYPDKQAMPIYFDEFKNALNTLHEISYATSKQIKNE